MSTTKTRNTRKHEKDLWSWVPIVSFACSVVGALASGACTHAHAKAAPDVPALDMPAPPDRAVEPIEIEPLTSTTTAEPDESTRRTTTARPRATPPTREPAKPETPKPAEPAKPEPPPPEPPKTEEPKPAPPLQTAPAIAEGESERTIRATIVRATTDLNHVDYRALNTDGRSQYDQAKRLMRQAEDAVREKNLVFARSVADKAATIAAQLAKR